MHFREFSKDLITDNFVGYLQKNMCSCPGLSCRTEFNNFVKIAKYFTARLIFVIYCFVAVWRVTQALRNELYWLLLITLIPLCVEAFYTVNKHRSGQKETSALLKW